MKWFPARNISVIDLLKTSLPPRSSALITSKPTAWFSNDSPRSDIDCLADQPIPNDAFLNELAAIEGQAWLNGTQSFVDPRFNDGQDRLPLWAPMYWREMNRVASARTIWTKCERWLAVTPDPKVQSDDRTQAFENARAFLPGLGWDTPVSALDSRLSTTELAKLLGTEWISSSLLQMMVDNISTRVRADPKTASTTIIGGPGFAQALESAAFDKKAYTRTTTPLLCCYEKHITEAKIEHLYFPAHVNSNHWIAVHVDFKQHKFSYGEFVQTRYTEILTID